MQTAAKPIWTTVALVVLVLLSVVVGTQIQGCDGPPPIPVLEAIHHVNKQVFIEHYLVVDVHHTDRPQKGWEWLENLGLKQDFIVLIRGRVPAGFDLKQVTQDHIWTSGDGKSVQLTLPPPMVFRENVSIDSENSHVLYCQDTCPDWLCGDEISEYLEQVEPAAEEALIDGAVRNGILAQTAKDGKAYYEQFLASLGFEQVRVVVTGYGF